MRDLKPGDIVRVRHSSRFGHIDPGYSPVTLMVLVHNEEDGELEFHPVRFNVLKALCPDRFAHIDSCSRYERAPSVMIFSKD